MTTPEVAARLRYLNDAAHLLVSGSHSTSSFIMSRCNSLMFDNDIEQPTTHRRKVCNACGNILVLGGTAKIDFSPKNHKKIARRKHRGSKQKGIATQGLETKSLLYRCEPCGRQTQYLVDTPKPKAIRSKGDAVIPTTMTNPASLSSTPSSQPNPNQQLPKAQSSANASSKKRAKSRKQGGLQALLAKNREATLRGPTTGFGLDIMDLMKKG